MLDNFPHLLAIRDTRPRNHLKANNDFAFDFVVEAMETEGHIISSTIALIIFIASTDSPNQVACHFNAQ